MSVCCHHRVVDLYSPIRLVPEIKNSNITCSNNFEMDTKIKEESFSDDVAPQNETEFFRKVITMKRNCDTVLVDNCSDVPIKTEVKSEAPFTKHLAKQITSEGVTCSSNWEIDRKALFDEEILISDFGSQSEAKLLSGDPVAKLRKFNSVHEMGNKIEIKEEPLWPETETSEICDDIKVGDFPPVSYSRLCTQGVSSDLSAKSLLIAAEVSGRATSFYPGKDDPECECWKSDDSEIPSAEDVLSEQSGKCSEKKDMYIRPLNLKQRNLIHKCKRRHKYEAVGKSFTQLSYLKTHNLIQEGKKSHKCKTCNKSFPQLSNLNRHSLIHEGKKPHQCKTCDRSFTELSNLKKHYLIHEGKKPHQCKTCEKSFRLLSDLKTHYLIHEGKKPHQCKTCDRSFLHLSSLKTHYFIHEGRKPHHCKTCNMSVTWLSFLKIHSLIHEGKKPHKYKSCNKSFTKVSDLKRYSLIHDGKKPHQ